ncbi:hypothetical protein EV385_0495 [Krasilnikovia cinnamomea]|uniref:Mce-associated membrane protein n=1 Tax=Krasilnikovia cinnamomea TaxID=349313 RepID=A0A4Q7ZET0_9ACTN|nr:hypothetical protein [Krasilnikovia cinnamomea]RZU48771.1 hypothetical protein EV385_0495 [Krasilnikovia cinnamomea]
MFTRPVLVGLVAASVLLGAGCSSGKPKGAPVPQPPSTSSTPSLEPGATAERDALIAYRGMWSAFVEAAKTSDPEAPDLGKYASDQALRLIASGLYTDRDQGKVTKGNLILSPKVTGVKPAQAPTEVTVLDCVDSTKWLEYKVSGEPWDDKPGGKHRTTATVKNSDGTWKVSSFILEESGTC